MIKSAGDMISEIKQQMRGGTGSVELKHVFMQEELTGKARLFARVTLNPGCSIGKHEHVNEEEIYYIIEGKGLVNDNGTESEIVSGDAVLTGGGAFHSIENRSDRPLTMLAVILLFV